MLGSCTAFSRQGPNFIVDLEQQRTSMIEMHDNQIMPSYNHTLLNENISEIGMGKYQYTLFLLCGFGWAADNMYMQALSVIQIPVQLEFKLTNSQVGNLGFSMMLGMFFGSFIWGIISDIFGRKPAFNLTLAITALFSVSTAFAPNFLVLSILLALMGFGVGGNMPIDAALFLEFVPSSHKGLMILMGSFWSIGQLITSVVAWSILSLPGMMCDPQTSICDSSLNSGWRIVQLSLGLVTVLMVTARVSWFHLYESPKYLISKGKFVEACDVLTILAKENDKKLIIQPDDFLLDNKESVQEKTDYFLHHTLKIMFSKQLYKTTILIALISMFVSLGTCCIHLGNNMFFTFIPKFLSMGAIQPLSLSETYRNYLIVSLFSIPGPPLAMYACESILGRRSIMSLSTILVAVCLALFTLCKTSSQQLLLTCLAGFFQNCMYAVKDSYTPEVFPTGIRGSAVGLAASLGRLMGCFAPILTWYLLDFNVRFPVYISAGLLAMGALLMAMLPIDTKGAVPH